LVQNKTIFEIGYLITTTKSFSQSWTNVHVISLFSVIPIMSSWMTGELMMPSNSWCESHIAMWI